MGGGRGEGGGRGCETDKGGGTWCWKGGARGIRGGGRGGGGKGVREG